jgi:competence protein ComEA
VEYRTKVGKFSKIEDILNVKGIGEKKFQRMKDRLAI